jgi:hypothetical protein
MLPSCKAVPPDRGGELIPISTSAFQQKIKITVKS